MRTKVETQAFQVFQCEVCGRTSRKKDAIERCEAKHLKAKCPHTDIEYVVDFNPYGITVQKFCRKCDSCIAERELEEENMSQQLLEQLFYAGRKV